MTSSNVFFLDRPEQGNSLDLETAVQILKAAERAVKAKQKGIIIASQHPQIFCSGGDLKNYRNLSKSKGIALNKKIRDTLKALASQPLLVIAAIDGLTLGGGCELALACDLIATSPRARFSFKQTKMGVTPGWGGLERLLTRVSPATALQWLATARAITASEANRTGLSDFVFPSKSLIPECQKLIASACDLVSIKTLKTLVYDHSNAKEIKTFDTLWGGRTHNQQLRHFFE